MKQDIINPISRFKRISLVTVLAVYFLILVGGIVRSTGSGMGCPDWPKCFGSLVPPTNVDQLPKNYQDIYLEKRLVKNEKFVAQLRALGFSNKASEIENDSAIRVEQEFNPVKTWIEYINRLIGAIIGILVLLTVYRSLALWNKARSITVLSVINLLLVLFQAWIGSIVVSTNLLPWMITLHMVLALLIVCLLLYTHYKAYKFAYPSVQKTSNPKKLFNLLVIGFILMLVQVVMGTQVREGIDTVAAQFGYFFRERWIDALGFEFLFHRSFSILLVVVHLLFLYWVYKYTLLHSNIFKWTQMLVLVIILEIVTGVGMAYFAIPAFLQPIHLLLGSLIIGIQFVILLQLNDQKKLQLDNIN